MNILFVGKPGAGKGTLTQNLLASSDQFIQLSTGQLLREETERGTELGKEIDALLKQGKFASDETVLNLVGKFLENNSGKNIIFDGYPRNLQQAEVCEKNNIKFDIIFNIDVDDEILFERITNRWVHQPSGRTYNLKTLPPKKEGLDDLTGEPLSQRDDDKPEILKERLAIYKNVTAPVLDYYRKKQDIHDLDGTIDLKEQYKFIEDVISEQLKTESTNSKKPKFN